MAKKKTSKSVALTAVPAPLVSILYPEASGTVSLSSACTFTAEGSVDANAQRILYVYAVINGSTYYGYVPSNHLWTISNIVGRLGDCNKLDVYALVLNLDGMTTSTISASVLFTGTGGSNFCMTCPEINAMVAKKTAKKAPAKSNTLAKQKPAKAAKA